MDNKYKKAIKILNSGGVGIMRTDTIYGILGQAFEKKTVLRIYKLKKRSVNQPSIVIIGNFKDLDLFGITLNKLERDILKQLWPGKVSIILPCRKKFIFSDKNHRSIAFRMPEKKELRDIIKKTGPLIAPSANPGGMDPARNIDEAIKYFKDNVDFYIDDGKIEGIASTLVTLTNNGLVINRQGKYKISKKLLKK